MQFLAPNTEIQGRYEIVRLVGKGGMGAVYQANDKRLGSVVALKQTLFSEPELYVAFEREARLLATLRHLAIPRVIDHFADDNGQFLVMEFIHGSNLGQLLKQRGDPFLLEDVLAWVDQLLQALDYLHKRTPPIIHRDIKPPNIKVMDDGQLVLLDFGLAKGTPAFQTQMLSSISVRGYTMAYASLEQIQGSGTTPQSDIYSVGVTLYHLLSGSRFAPNINALARATARFTAQPDPLQPLHELNPLVPQSVSTIIMQALELNPQDRPENASAMREALRKASTPATVTAELGNKQTTPLSATPTSLPHLPASIPHTILQGHSESILSLDFSPAGNLVASGSHDHTICLWDIASGQQVQRLEGHTGLVLSLAFSPDRQTLASASDDNTVRLWDISSGKETLRLQTPCTAWSVAFNPDGRVLAAGSEDRMIRLWTLHSSEEVQILQGHTGRVYTIAFNHDGKLLASGSKDATVRLWDVTTSRQVSNLTNHVRPVYSVAFSPDSKILASSSEDRTIRLWELENGVEYCHLQAHNDDIISIAFSPDGTLLASGSSDKTVRIWDIASRRELRTLTGNREMVCVAFSPNGHWLGSGSLDKTIHLWNLGLPEASVPQQEHKQERKQDAGQVQKKSPDKQTPAAEPPQRRVVLRQSKRRGAAMLSPEAIEALNRNPPPSPAPKHPPARNRITTRPVAPPPSPYEPPMIISLAFRSHRDHVWGAEFSPRGYHIASGGSDHKVWLWDIARGIEERKYEAQNHVYSITFSPDGFFLAAGCGGNIVRIWEVSSGHEIALLDGHRGYVTRVMFSANGENLVSASSDRTICLWDISSGKVIQTLHQHYYVTDVVYSPNNRLLASSSLNPTVILWDVASGKTLQRLAEHTAAVRSVAFSPDGSILATASDDSTIRLWDVASGRCTHCLEGSMGSVQTIAFSADGRMLASGGLDYIVHLWDVEKAEEEERLEGHSGVVQSVRFSSDGKFLVTASSDWTARLWKLGISEDEWIELARAWREL